MIQGHIDGRRRPLIEVAVAGHRAETTVLALLDTGYEGHISLPLEVALALGLELDSAAEM
ncbi:MAG: hypothetical protein ACE5MB_07355 [Anaerolineae bacterium]